MSVSEVLAFTTVAIIAVAVPGPDFALITGIALRRGQRAGAAAALGIATGVCLWGVVTVIGLSALIASSVVAFNIVKLAGAAYLLYLGVRCLLAARRLSGPELTSEHVGMPSVGKGPTSRSSYVQGLMTNVLNPKVAVFFVTLIPQFLGPQPSVLETAEPAAILATIALVWFSTYSLLISRLRPLLQRRRSQQVLEGATGVVLTGVGLRLALERQ